MKPSTAIRIFMWFGVIYVGAATQSMIATFLFLGLVVAIQAYAEIKQEGLHG